MNSSIWRSCMFCSSFLLWLLSNCNLDFIAVEILFIMKQGSLPSFPHFDTVVKDEDKWSSCALTSSKNQWIIIVYFASIIYVRCSAAFKRFWFKKVDDKKKNRKRKSSWELFTLKPNDTAVQWNKTKTRKINMTEALKSQTERAQN